jgi:hypothetical protein
MTPVITRFYWGLRLYLAAPDSRTVTWWCLANQRRRASVAEALLDRPARHGVLRPGMVTLADKGLAGHQFEAGRGWCGSGRAATVKLLRMQHKGATSPPRQR